MLNTNAKLDELIGFMETDPLMSACFHMAYPRRILQPAGGYMSPKYYAPTLASAIYHLSQTDITLERDFVRSCILLVTQKLMTLRVPTFFVGQEFAEAVAETKIESAMRSDEIVWPDEAMLFVLPWKFSMEHFGYHIPFLALSRYSDEEVQKLNARYIDSKGEDKGPPTKEMMVGHVMMTYQWHESSTDTGVDYVSSWPLNYTLHQVTEHLDQGDLLITNEEKRMLGSGSIQHVGMADESIEKKMMCQMMDFSAKLLMAMTAEPVFVERGVREREARQKNGRLLQEVWTPNTLGYKYRHPRKDPVGSHASPRLHRRTGHFRDQHYGLKNVNVRRIWLKPTWVGVTVK